MKIYEQEWTLDAFGDVCRGMESLATHTNATPDEMRAMAAAPKMARALLMQATTNAHGKPCWCATPRTGHDSHEMRCIEAHDALRSAGVL